MKKIKHTSLKSLKKKAWKLQSEYIRKFEKGICYTCGVHKPWKECHAGHYIHGNWMDFAPMNIHCQCPRCNTYLSGNLGVYAERLMADYGIDAVENLRAWSIINKDKKYNIFELEDLIKTYTELLEET